MLPRPLTWAAAHGFTDRLRLLLAARRRPGRASRRRAGPLPLAAAAGHREIVELLLAAGAAPVALGSLEALVGTVAAITGDEADVDLSGAAGRRWQTRPGLVAAAVEAGADPGLAVRLGFKRVRPARRAGPRCTRAAWNGDLAGPAAGRARRRPGRAGRHGSAAEPVDWAGHAQHPDVVSFLQAGDPAAGERARGGPGPGSPPAGTAP